MRNITLAKSGLNKLRSHQTELKVSDFDDSIRSLPPGEWLSFSAGNDHWVGFINPAIGEKFACAQVLKKIDSHELSEFSPENFMRELIHKAYTKRMQFKGYQKNARLFFGASDGLPGLIIDHFLNASIIQINTAGVDRFRDVIKEYLTELTQTKAYFLDNKKYREKESLPVFETETIPGLEVMENGLRYYIRPEVLQKVGFYYDHRENRLQLMAMLSRLDKTLETGIDLFSYAGAWGMNALKAGVKEMLFIDQGDFQAEVDKALELNEMTGRGKFIRSDVFKYLDELIQSQKKFDLILCDPPAFAKSLLQKNQALDGYSKLHRKVLKCLRPGSFVAFSSCTHYVTHDEFQKNVLDAALKEGLKLQLIYTGIQGLDHPVISLSDKANYIKSYFYIVESL